jgi:hypothetical protein
MFFYMFFDFVKIKKHIKKHKKIKKNIKKLKKKHKNNYIILK